MQLAIYPVPCVLNHGSFSERKLSDKTDDHIPCSQIFYLVKIIFFSSKVVGALDNFCLKEGDLLSRKVNNKNVCGKAGTKYD